MSNVFTRLAKRFLGRKVRMKYDAARDTHENRRHWENADGLSADSAANPQSRYKLRTRGRYEAHESNSVLNGMVWTLANDTIGTGPRLQINTEDEADNTRIEKAFARWSRETGLPQRLRTMRVAKCVDGEALAFFVTNNRLRSPIKLDIKLVEADQMTSVVMPTDPTREVDGVIFDENGTPIAYRLLKYHPGAMFQGMHLATEVLPVERVIHYFRQDRAGQHRGIPELATALPLVASTRRYTNAVVAAAETAADYAAVLESQAQVEPGEHDDPSAWDGIELTPRMLATLPAGWKLSQLKAEQPATTYDEFISSLIGQMARCIQMPLNIALGNSSKWNFASGRLDHLIYHASIWIERDFIATVILDRIFMEWLREAVLISGILPQEARARDADFEELFPHEWHWDAPEQVDPTKEATAQQTRLTAGTTTYARELANDGQDWREHFEQLARERDLAEQLGLQLNQTQPAPAMVPAGTDPNDGEGPSQNH